MLGPGALVEGRYRLERLLGRGGMAEVYRAVDSRDNDAVAVKVLHGDAGPTRRFRAEVAAIGALDHPGIVRLRDSGVDGGGHPYLVLDLVEGPSLAAVIASGPLAVERAVGIGGQIAAALAHAHGRGVIHRDVKPSNVLLDGAGRARLVDFGVARLAASTRVTAAGVVIGSVPYLAPEQVEGRGAGPASDVYALGLVLHECLTGTPCYPGGDAEAAFARLRRQPAVPDSAPSWLRHVLGAMTAHDPKVRPTAEDVTAALAERNVAPVLLDTAPVAVLDATTTSTRHDDVVRNAPASRGGWERLLVVAGLVLVSFFAWQALPHDDSGADRPAATPSSTVTVPPTTAPPPPTTTVPVDAAAEAPDDNHPGNGNGNGNGRGRGNNKNDS